jgi:hypothetical protein
MKGAAPVFEAKVMPGRQASWRAALRHNQVLRAKRQRGGCGGTFSDLHEFRTVKAPQAR